MKKLILAVLVSVATASVAFAQSADDEGWKYVENYHLVLNPDYDIYGLEFSGIPSDGPKWLGMTFGINHAFVSHGGTSMYFGVGPMGFYSVGSIGFQIAVNPYLGLSWNEKLMENSDSYEIDTEFTYGLIGRVGVSVKVSDKWSVSGGYSLTAGKFKFENLKESGMWLVGITRTI